MIAAVLLAMGFPSNSTAQTQIRLATMVPSGTSYHHSLQALGEKWRKDSNGAIALKIYADGTMGGEAEIVRRMRVGQLQAATPLHTTRASTWPTGEITGLAPIRRRGLSQKGKVS